MIGNIIPETAYERARLGRFTASEIDNLLTEPKSKADREMGLISESAKKYIHRKAAEIITGTIRQVTNFSMEWGKQYEPEAISLIKEEYPSLEYMGGEEPRFFKLSDFAGGSPDAWDEKEKMVFEVKCPEDPSNHITYSMLGDAADLQKYYRDCYHQIQMNMLCVAQELGLDFSEMRGLFGSYCPTVREPYSKLFKMIIYPDRDFYQRIFPALENAEKYLAEILWTMDKTNENVSVMIIEKG